MTITSESIELPLGDLPSSLLASLHISELASAKCHFDYHNSNKNYSISCGCTSDDSIGNELLELVVA
jgi:hypothetical protein